MTTARTRETKLIAIRMNPEAWEHAKQQADAEGMYLGRWLERAIKREIACSAKLAALQEKV